MESDSLSDIVRVGIVSAVNISKRQARVHFPHLDIPSGWLHVIQHNLADIYVASDGEHKHEITDTFTGGGSASMQPDHNHTGTHLTYWMPKVNDKVLVLYIPVFNGDGFILGGI